MINRFNNKIIEFLIFSFWMVTIFDPIGSIFNLKYIVILSILLYMLAYIFVFQNTIIFNKLSLIYYVLFVLFIPFYGSLLALINGGFEGRFTDTSYISSSIYIICSFIYLFNKNNFKIGINMALISLRILSLIILIIFINDVFKFNLNGLSQFFIENGVLFKSERYYGEINFPYIYFISSPLLVILLSYDSYNFINRANLFSFFILIFTSLTLFLTGTRMNMIISIITFFSVFLWNKYGRLSLIYIIVVIFILVFFIFILNNNLFESIFSYNDTSNNVKINYLSMYLDLFNKEKVSLIFGQGFNSHVWSHHFFNMLENNLEASKVELTYIELLRVYGIFIGSMIIFLLMILPFFKVHEYDKYYYLFVAFFLYLISTSLNPYLFSSNGMSFIGIVLAIINFKIRSENVQK